MPMKNRTSSHSNFRLFLFFSVFSSWDIYNRAKNNNNDNGWRDGLVVSALDQRPRGRGFESVGCGLSCSKRGPVALCTLGLGLLNPPSSRRL